MPADPLNRRRRPRIARRSARLVLQAAQTADDGQGGRSIAWLDIATLWAAIEPQTGFADVESFRFGQTAAHQRARIWLRHRLANAPAPGMRFVEQGTGRIWRIEAVADPDGARRYLVCQCIAEPL